MKTNCLPGKHSSGKPQIQELKHNNFSYCFSAANRERKKAFNSAICVHWKWHQYLGKDLFNFCDPRGGKMR